MAQRLEIIISAKDQTGKVFGGVTNSLQKVGKLALGVAAGGAAALGAGFVALASKAIPAASDVTESMNAVNKVFGESADTILSWGNQAATQAGLAQSEFFQMSSQTGAMLQNLGLEQSMAAEESVNLAQRAADMASIFNTDVSDALGAIQAGLRGEADPLERFGVRLSAAAVQAHAVEMGLIGASGEMDDQTRALASLSLLYKQTENLSGDFVETSGDLANAQRVANAQWQNFLANIGQIGLPILGKFWQTLSSSVLPTLNTFASYIGNVVSEGDVMNDFLADLPEWLQPIAETVGNVIVAFQDFFANISEGMDPVTALADTLKDLFGEDVANKFLEIADGVREFIASVQEALEPVVNWIQNNVELKDVLIALGIAVASVVVPALLTMLGTLISIAAPFIILIGIIALLRKAWETDWNGMRTKLTEFWEGSVKPAFEQIKAWLEVNIPIAIEKAKDFWENTLKPAMENVGEWITGTLIPIIADIVGWLQENIPIAIQAASDFWENTLKPALETVWEFIQDKVIPIIEDVVGWLQDNIPKAIETASDFWTETLQPALEDVWGVINDDIIPVIEDVIGWLGDLGSKALEIANGALSTIRGVFDGISGAVQDVISWVGDLIEKLKNIKLPPLLTPGSPSPFEQSLIGIADAMAEISRIGLPQLQSTFSVTGGQLPPRVVYGGSQAPAGGQFASQPSYSMPIYGGLTLQNITDIESLLDELSSMML